MSPLARVRVFNPFVLNPRLGWVQEDATSCHASIFEPRTSGHLSGTDPDKCGLWFSVKSKMPSHVSDPMCSNSVEPSRQQIAIVPRLAHGMSAGWKPLASGSQVAVLQQALCGHYGFLCC